MVFKVPSNPKDAVTPCLDLPCQDHHPGEVKLCRKNPWEIRTPPQEDGTSLAVPPLGAPPPLDVAAGLGLLPGCTESLVSHLCLS